MRLNAATKLASCEHVNITPTTESRITLHPSMLYVDMLYCGKNVRVPRRVITSYGEIFTEFRKLLGEAQRSPCNWHQIRTAAQCSWIEAQRGPNGIFTEFRKLFGSVHGMFGCDPWKS